MPSYNFKADEKLQAVILRNSESVHVKAGSTLFSEGEKARGMYLLVSGKVELLLHSAGLVSLERRAVPGCLIGVPASINHHPYSLTARVEEDAELRFVSVQKLADLMRRDPWLTMQLVTMLSEEVRDMRKYVANPQKVAVSH
jgi:CRP/FNR family transcriptional regulator, polysaccharide utilization system transcription regulator